MTRSSRTGPIAAFLAAALLTAACVLFIDDPAAVFAHETFHSAAVFIDLTHIVDPVLPLSAIGFLVIGGAMLVDWRPSGALRLVLTLCLASLVAIMIKDQLNMPSAGPGLRPGPTAIRPGSAIMWTVSSRSTAARGGPPSRPAT